MTIEWLLGFLVAGLALSGQIGVMRAISVRRRAALKALVEPPHTPGNAPKAVEPRRSARGGGTYDDLGDGPDAEPRTCAKLVTVIYLGGTQPEGLPDETVAACEEEHGHAGDGMGIYGYDVRRRHASKVHGSIIRWTDAEDHVVIEPMEIL